VEFVRQAANVEELPIVGADRDRAVEVVVGEGQVGRFRAGDLVAIDVRTRTSLAYSIASGEKSRRVT
jgi:hypothetical protein